MNSKLTPVLGAIQKWIGPKLAAAIAFAAYLGIDLTKIDLSGITSAITDTLAIDSEVTLKAAVIALIAYFFRATPTDKPLPQKPDTSPAKPAQRFDDTLFDSPDYNDPSPTILKPAKNWFTDAELDCKCPDLPGCDYQGIDKTTLAIVNDLREVFGPLFVNSGYRCPEWNERVGGAKASYHVKGMAIDLRSPTATPHEIYDYLVAKYPEQYGFGQYSSFVHVDSRDGVYARKASADAQWIQYRAKNHDIDLSPA